MKRKSCLQILESSFNVLSVCRGILYCLGSAGQQEARPDI